MRVFNCVQVLVSYAYDFIRINDYMLRQRMQCKQRSLKGMVRRFSMETGVLEGFCVDGAGLELVLIGDEVADFFLGLAVLREANVVGDEGDDLAVEILVHVEDSARVVEDTGVVGGREEGEKSGKGGGRERRRTCSRRRSRSRRGASGGRAR